MQKEENIKQIYEAKTVVAKLESLMDRVTEQQATPETVQAAVSCVSAINELLKTHLKQQELLMEMERMKRLIKA